MLITMFKNKSSFVYISRIFLCKVIYMYVYLLICIGIEAKIFKFGKQCKKSGEAVGRSLSQAQ